MRAINSFPNFNVLKKILYVHPTSITHIVNIFSASVFGATFPKPTDVSDVNVK